MRREITNCPVRSLNDSTSFIMRLIRRDSEMTVIVFNLLERIGGTHPWQSSLLYPEMSRRDRLSV